MPSVQSPETEDDFNQLIESLPDDAVIALNFHTAWADPCVQMNQVFKAIAESLPDNTKVKFISVDAEELPDVSERYEVSAVPLVLLYKNGGRVGMVSGADAKELKNQIDRAVGSGNALPSNTTIPPAQSVNAPSSAAGANGATSDSTMTDAAEEEEEPLQERLSKLVKAAPVMLFMKGTPAAPQCGFSRQLVALLREKGVRYGFFNILADDEVRQGLKEFSNWPTYPQLYVHGDLVGGLDIVKEELENDPGFFANLAVVEQPRA